jgi:alkylation response protein AidB-like acyl-CoA dehydrogenase
VERPETAETYGKTVRVSQGTSSGVRQVGATGGEIMDVCELTQEIQRLVIARRLLGKTSAQPR